MIDYENMKAQIDLMHKMIIREEKNTNNQDSQNLHTSISYALENIYSCLNQLKELSVSNKPKPEPKYKDGQEVWVMYLPIYTDTMHLGKFKTDAHKYEDGVHKYCLSGNGIGLTWREENTIYASKQELIEAQIEYWQSMLGEKETKEKPTL